MPWRALGSHSDLYQRIETLPVGAPPAAFDNLSGEVHASVKAALRDVDTSTRTLTFKHLRNNLNSILHSGAFTAQAGTSDAPALMSSVPQGGALPVWAEVVGNWQTRDSDVNAARATQRNGGLIAGMDHAVGNGWRVGGALGYTDSTLRVNDRNSKSQVSSYSATLYGSQPFTVAGAPVARDTALLELGADIAVSRNATLGVSYGGQIGKGSREHSGSLSMRWRF